MDVARDFSSQSFNNQARLSSQDNQEMPGEKTARAMSSFVKGM